MQLIRKSDFRFFRMTYGPGTVSAGQAILSRIWPIKGPGPSSKLVITSPLRKAAERTLQLQTETARKSFSAHHPDSPAQAARPKK